MNETLMHMAYRCHWTATALFALMAIVYISRKRFMPYHAIALQKTWTQLDRPTQAFFMASMKITGSAWMAVAIALGLILEYGFNHGQPWAIVGVPLVGLTVAIPTLLAVLSVKFNTKASPPWPPLAAAVLLFVVGLVFSLLA